MTPRLLASEQEAIAFGRELAAGLRSGSVVALIGGLGAGKTHVTKGIAAGLGFGGEVTSPTFTLVHEYTGPGLRLPVFHFDFYRLDAAAEAVALGWDDYLEREGVCVVEWADRFPELLPPGTEWWRLTASAGGGRLAERVGGSISPSPDA
jgi:tRNA threonylcarbamoyladenosine biosynthesis protein TsaE